MSLSPVSYTAQMRSTPDKIMSGGGDVPSQTSSIWGEDGLTFGDMLDVINPLQHIPVVSTIYRHLTGDTISDAARMAGGTLYGGPIGFGVALANVVTEHTTGKDFGETAYAMVFDDAAPAEIQVAQADTSQAAFSASAAPDSWPRQLIPDALPAGSALPPLPGFEKHAPLSVTVPVGLTSTAPLPSERDVSAAYQRAQLLSLFDA